MRVLIVRLSALGDIIHAWPLAEMIRSSRSDVHLTWVVEGAFRPLVEGHPAIDEVVEVRTRTWRRHPLARQTRAEVAGVLRDLRSIRPDVALDPQGLLKSAIVAWTSGAPRRVGFARCWRREAVAGLAYTDTVAGPSGPTHVVETNLALLRALDIDIPDPPPTPDGRWILTHRAGRVEVRCPQRHYAVVLPGAGAPSKILPISTLADVSTGLAAQGLRVVVAWGPGEQPRARSIVAAAGDGVELAPATDLLQLAALIGDARLVIGGDTGPIHLAASLGVPTIGCYLATDWRRNGPLGRRVSVIAAAAVSGSPSRRAQSRPVREISAEEVLATALRELT